MRNVCYKVCGKDIIRLLDNKQYTSFKAFYTTRRVWYRWHEILSVCNTDNCILTLPRLFVFDECVACVTDDLEIWMEHWHNAVALHGIKWRTCNFLTKKRHFLNFYSIMYFLKELLNTVAHPSYFSNVILFLVCFSHCGFQPVKW